MRATHLAIGLALVTGLGVTAPSYAADDSVLVAALQFVPSGWVAPAPVVAGTAVEVAPAVPNIKRLNRIVWTNLDPLQHRVECVSAPPSGSCFSLRQDMPMATPGATSNLQTTAGMALGKYVYRCVVHLGMRGAFNLTL